MVVVVTLCCKSANEKDRHTGKSFRGEDDEDDPEELHSVGCLSLPELLMATAKANVVRLELAFLLETPPPLLLERGLLFLTSQLAILQTRRFLRFLVYAFSGFERFFMDDDDASAKLAKDLDFPL